MKRRLPAAQRKAQILDKAAIIFARKGYAGATTREIAAACRVSEGVIYQHFRTKEDLFQQSLERKIAEHDIEGFLAGIPESLPLLERFTLMASRGVDDVTIAEITRHADVGHGTFYLHFKSKYDVLVPIVRDRAAAWDAHVQRHLAGVDDPAEVLACSARHMARAVLRDPLWHWFLTHSQVPVEDMGAAIGRFGSRDVQTGLAVGRFSIADQEVWDRFILGAYVSTLLGCADREEGVAAQAIDDMVELMLRTLGVPLDESAAVAHRPLQDIQTPDPGVSAQGG